MSPGMKPNSRQFRVVLDLGNAAFDDNPCPEVTRILRSLADKIEADDLLLEGAAELPLFDVTGNCVGAARRGR